MTGIGVRVAVREDVPGLAALGRSVFLATYGPTSDPDDIDMHLQRHFSEAAVSAAMTDPDVQYLVATEGDSYAGLVKLRDNATHALVPATSAIEVQQVYVSTEHQRKGVGRALMDAAVETASRRGVAGVWLSVWRRADWATSFYTDYGFRSLGEVSFDIGTTRYVDFLMWLPIDAV